MKNFNAMLIARAIATILVFAGDIAQPVYAESLGMNPSPKRIAMQCGKHTVVIMCGKKVNPDYSEDDRQCNHNTLIFVDLNGREFIPPLPNNFDESKTPVSIGCKKSSINEKYFVLVELNEGPSGCLPCMTYHLFSEDGSRLTADSTDAMRQLARFNKKFKLYEIGKRVEIEPDPFLQNNLKGDRK